MAVHRLAVVNETPFDRRVLRHQGPVELYDALIDPAAYVGPYAVVYRGIEKPTYIGPGALVEAHAVIGHDVQIEEDAEVASLCGIAGYAIIRKGAKIATGACIQPYICVGEGARVGTGAVVTKHVMAGQTVAGVPAGPLRAWSRDRLKCGCSSVEVWDGCPHHGSSPVC